VADYLAAQQEILIRFHNAKTTAARNAALNDLVTHADKHRDLIEQAARYQTSHGNYAQDPLANRPQSPEDSPKRQTRRAANA
jgi:hypothetical protein